MTRSFNSPHEQQSRTKPNFDGKEVATAFRTRCSPVNFGFCNIGIRDVEILGFLNTWFPGLLVVNMNRAFALDRILETCFEDVTKPNKHGFYLHKLTIKKKRYTFYYVSKDKKEPPVMLDDHQEWLEAAEMNVIRRSGRAQPTKRKNEIHEEDSTKGKYAKTSTTPPTMRNNGLQPHPPPLTIGFSAASMQISSPSDGSHSMAATTNHAQMMESPRFLIGGEAGSVPSAAKTVNDGNPGILPVGNPEVLPIGFTATSEETIRFIQAMEDNFFDQPRMCLLFKGKQDTPGSAKNNLLGWIETLSTAPFSLASMAKIVNKADVYPLTPEQLPKLQFMATYLCLVYKIALVNMPDGQTFQGCIEEASRRLALVYGNEHIKRHHSTISRWHKFFREDGCLPHPNHLVQNGKDPSPALFVNVPEAKLKFEKWAKENVATLSTETALVYIKETLLPEVYNVLLEERVKDDAGSPMTYEDFLASMKLTKVSRSTARRCIASAGLVYKDHKKSISMIVMKTLRTLHTGLHSSKSTSKRKSFHIGGCSSLSRMPSNWKMKGNADNEKLLPQSFVFEYTDTPTGIQMREYHIDAFHEEFKRYIKPENAIHNGNLSYRFPSDRRPVIIIGQDESIYKQFSFSAKTWYTKDGVTKLLPKDDGHGLMVSACVSRSWGFLMDGNPALGNALPLINQLRLQMRHRTYISTESAMKIKGTAFKSEVVNSESFTRFFQYGNDKEGYWCYDHIALQLEDIVDCLVIMFPVHDFLFLFDQSSGHGRQQTDGLNALNMNNDWGGAVPNMRDTETVDKSCLGPYNHPRKLKVGDVQHLVYQASDPGPVAKKGRLLDDAQRLE